MTNRLLSIEAGNKALERRFADKLKVNKHLNRQLVSFQANKQRPGYRWFKYKEGFSEPLVQYLLDHVRLNDGYVLDPFCGSGTLLFAAQARGLQARGIELLPVGTEIVKARQLMQSRPELSARISHWFEHTLWHEHQGRQAFAHLRITNGAFPEQTESQLAQYLSAADEEEPDINAVLRFAAMCVLEEISYTRKDGQYLRWDYRSGRTQGTKPFNKGEIYPFSSAIRQKLHQIVEDVQPAQTLPGFFPALSTPLPQSGSIQMLQGSCLNMLPTIPSSTFDGLITSPPYANRYDYTRTYALELAFLGVDEHRIRELRQAMISCTVENRDKDFLRSAFSPAVFDSASRVFDQQEQLCAILDFLEEQRTLKLLNNPGIPRMIRNYFFEMSLIIFEAARLLQPRAPFVMVNDNVRYGGASIPVDLILSDFAQQAGFDVEVIWVLPAGKGNSSQQMGQHGREETRKCIYIWRRAGA